MKILQIYNSAAHYRDSIFRLIDATFDCDFIFGANLGDIKQMDTSTFRGHVTKVQNYFVSGHWYWQKGVQKFLRKKYDSFIILGDIHCLSTWLFCVRARLFYRSKKIFFWTHGWYGKETRMEALIKKLFYHLANGGIFLYGSYARDLMIKEGFQAEKLHVIHNSLSYDNQLALRSRLIKTSIYKERFGNDDPILFFVGRLTQVKHLDLLMQALYLLRQKGKQFNMVLVGDGSQRNILHKLSQEMNLSSRIWFYGPCYDDNHLGELIYNADLCVSPGNVGLTAIHSMVFGTPVLTHDDFSWQMPEFESIKDGKTGTFFKRNNIESLAEAIEKWFTQPEYDREVIRKNCFHEIDEYWTPQFQLQVLKEYLQ